MGDVNDREKGYVLVIDDDPLLRKTLKNLLEKQGYLVDLAKDGYEGVKKAKTGFFHLILCDIRMPGLDGLMTIRHIRDFQNQAGAGRSGFIVVSAYDTNDTRHQAFQLGVTDFLLKPFDKDKFLETIGHHIEPLIEKTPHHEVDQLNQRLERLLSAVKPEKDMEEKR